jgi:20S proteasome alpha/beta subunit
MRFLARCVGNLSDKINEELETGYKEGLTNKDAIKLGLKLFKKVLEDEYNAERFDVVTMDMDENIKRYSVEEFKDFV